MDSLSQAALGAAIGVSVMGRRTALWKAAAWGALAGTLPDLDVFIDHGNPVHNMVLHRAETHALFWLTLFSLPFSALVAWLSGPMALWKRWWLALWLALVTHPLLDAMTVYGTQLALPFTDHPYGVGSMFIIDPLYTLPLLAGVAIALARRHPRASTLGLALSTAYLGWSALAQAYVRDVADDTITAQQIAAERVLVTPSPFNTIAWRVVVMQPDHYLEGYYSLLDAQRTIRFDRFERGSALEPELRGVDAYERLSRFSRGFYALRQDGARVLMSDLRMGQEPTYTFTFAVAERASPARALAVPQQVGTRPDVARVLPWLWRRIGGDAAPPPR
jgi:inner membrane protein